MMYCLTQEEYDALKEDTSDNELKIMVDKFDGLFKLIAESNIHSYYKVQELNAEYVALELRVDDLPEWLSNLIERKQGKENEQK